MKAFLADLLDDLVDPRAVREHRPHQLALGRRTALGVLGASLAATDDRGRGDAGSGGLDWRRSRRRLSSQLALQYFARHAAHLARSGDVEIAHDLVGGRAYA